MSIPLSRRTLLGLAVGSAAAVAISPEAADAAPIKAFPQHKDIEALEDKIRDGMNRYRIPGVAVGLWWRGFTYLRGFGVTDVDHPTPVTADTVFRVGSTTKTFTGTTIMRLVERHRIDLDRTVHSYLPDFRTADPAASKRVTGPAGAEPQRRLAGRLLPRHGRRRRRDRQVRGRHGAAPPAHPAGYDVRLQQRGARAGRPAHRND